MRSSMGAVRQNLYPALGGRRFVIGTALVVVVVAGLLLWVLSGVASRYSQQVVLGISTGSLFGLVALALVLIYRSTGVVNFAQGEMATLSAFIAWSLLQRFGDSPAAVWAVMAITAGIAFVIGALMELLVVRRVEHRPALHAIVVVLGFFAIFNSVASWRYGNLPKPFPTPFSTGTVDLGTVTVTYHTVGVIGVGLAMTALMFALLQFTKLGLAMRATAENPAASRMMGIDTRRMLTLGWGLSAAVGAVAGVMVAHTLNLSPLLMVNVLIFAFAGAVVGGLTSPGGALLGGILVGVAQNVLGITDFLGGSQLRVFWAFAFILLVLVIRPNGLFGRPLARRL